MKKLMTYLKDYTKESILAPLFKLLEASFELFVPLVVASIIDRGIEGGDRGYVLRMCLVMVALGLVGFCSAVCAQFFAAKASVGYAGKLRRALFEKIQSFSYAQLDKLGTNSLITRMTSDINQVQNALNLTLRLFLRSPVIVFGAMIMAFTIHVKAALIFVVTIPLLSVVVFGIMLLSIPLYRKVQEKLDRVLGITRENLTGVRVIRAFCKEEDEIRDFDERNHALDQMQRRVGMLSALMNPLTYVIINFAIIVLIRTGAVLVNDSILTQGEVVALYNYMSQILIELIKLANLIITMTRGFAGLSRISKVLEQPSAPAPIESRAEQTEYAVELRDVSLTYPNAGDESLTRINLRVKSGEVIGIIGGTGSGKTSLINLLPRFYDCTGGTVLVDGLDVKAWDTDALRKKIAVVPQKAQLFAGTIRENLRFGAPDADDSTLLRALSAAQAMDIVEKKEGGLDAMIEQGGRNLSGGQRQRLTIARALATSPEILILDDSASALDYATDAKLRAAIRELPNSPTLFIVSQRTASLRHADQILVLEDGEAVAVGTHEDLLTTCPVYSEIHYAQYPRDQKEVG